jgi:UDP-N-acetylglucosamine--N-acetylmuramyl-(pentapeptide) pyrophosphoryl-undecaprenol N-acetylglucosamine transferase
MSGQSGWAGKTLLVMAGGTGGHIYPALACAQQVIAEGGEVYWLGTRKGLEAEIIPRAGIPIKYIDIAGLRGNGTLGWLKAPFRILKAIGQAVRIISDVKPDVVLGMGGFVTGPGGVAARAKGIPLVIHEQNAIPGLTNKLLARISNRVLEAFPGTFECANESTGNPVRADLIFSDGPSERGVGESTDTRILVVGGSLGAVAINKLVPEALEVLKRNGLLFKVTHQTGKKNLEQTRGFYSACNVEADVVPYIENMSDAYRAADLVICRAGALTVSELMSVGVGSILVPFPYAVDDHQTKNAGYLVSVGAGVICQQRDTDAEKFSLLIEELIKNKNLSVMAKKAWQSRKVDATDRVLGHCQELMNV